MIMDIKKVRKVEWVIENKGMLFEDIIFSDGSTIKIITHLGLVAVKEDRV